MHHRTAGERRLDTATLKEEEEKEEKILITKSTTIYTSGDDIPCTWADNTAAGSYYSGV